MNEQEEFAKVTARAAVDVEYRRRLLATPRAAMAEVLGPLPTNVEIRFIEKDSKLDALIVLPDLIPDAENLTAEELEAVAGGTCVGVSGCACSTCCYTGS